MDFGRRSFVAMGITAYASVGLTEINMSSVSSWFLIDIKQHAM